MFQHPLTEDDLGVGLAIADEIGCAIYRLAESLRPRHVRTGEYRSDRRIVRLMSSVPDAITVCGAPATGRDVGREGAKALAREGDRTLCSTCAERLDLKSHAHVGPGKATPAQVNFLRRLVQAAPVRFATGLDARHLERLTKREASAKIDELKAAQARGWK